MKKLILVILVFSALVGCTNKDQIENYEKELKEKNNTIEKTNEALEDSQNKIVFLEEEHQRNITKFKEKVSSLEDEITVFKLENDNLKASQSAADEASDNKIVDQKDMIYEKKSLTEIFSVKNRKITKNLGGNLISKADAATLYTESQKFYKEYIIHSMYRGLTPKEDYDIYSSNAFDSDILDDWYLLAIDETPLSVDDFDEVVLDYFTEDVLKEIYNKHVVYDLEDKNGSGKFLIHKGYVFIQEATGGGDHENILLFNQLNLSLTDTSDSFDVITYNISVPNLHFDLMSGDFEEVYFHDEVVQYVKTQEGWRMNTIPTIYILSSHSYF